LFLFHLRSAAYPCSDASPALRGEWHCGYAAVMRCAPRARLPAEVWGVWIQHLSE